MATNSASLSTINVVRRSSAKISVANANRDGTGAVVPLFSAAGANGSRLDAIQIKAQGTTTAGTIRLYLNGVLFDEVSVPATILNPIFSPTWAAVYVPPTTYNLAGPDVISASTVNGEQFNLCAFGWDY